MTQSAMIADALHFASEAHASIGQLRKYAGEPYVVHPIAVAEIVRSVPHTEAMICAALLHDVVEDTPVTHSAAGPAQSQTIKVADLIDNTRSIVAHDPDFAVVYMREKRMLLDLLTKADPALREVAEGQMRVYEAQRRATPRYGDGDTPTINATIRAAQAHGIR